MTRSIRTILPFAFLVSISASLGGYFTRLGLDPWYATLQKPSWTPAPGVFGPVWTVLYALMAFSAWRVFNKMGGLRLARLPLTLWGVQLALNALWSGFFFALQSPLLGLIEILVLMGFVLATTVVFSKADRLSGLLMLPYCLWGSFATALNFAIWRLN